MQDDNTNTEVVEEVVADEPQTVDELTTVDEPTEEVVEQVEEAPAVEETKVEETEKPPSRREQLRIQDLLKKYGPPENRPAPSQRPDALDYEKELNADPEVIQQLNADRQRSQDSGYNEGLKQAEFLNWKTSLKIDAPNIEKKYPVLDKNSDQFHPAVADAVNSWYLNMSGYDGNNIVNNPNVGYADFVEGFMELVQETAGQKITETTKNIAKQAAATGLRPDGSTAPTMNLNKDPSQMSIEELYASLGQKPPK